ncbi:uncharacterized protein N7458_004266 [Penicillium daleae]|uniref:Uncharacterized protein n=1 Tax=Penicillium daleae TaxID=63821 RepID=A0AAD6CC83_9EURO|nr:uncharacterized protein N7458_004266 [Penicillium daleae]KAJ5456002.1 hypothetical protein N7458_004266 [Penicillium daleae]
MYCGCIDWLLGRFNLHSNWELSSDPWCFLWWSVYFGGYFNPTGPLYSRRQRMSNRLKLYPDYGLSYFITLRRPLSRNTDRVAEYSLHCRCIQCLSHGPNLHTDGNVQWALHSYGDANADIYFLDLDELTL